MTLLSLMSENLHYGYEEMLRMPAHILLGLWNAHVDVVKRRNEEEKKRQKEAEGGQSLSSLSMPSGMSSMLNSAKGIQSGSMKLPGMPSMPSGFKM